MAATAAVSLIRLSVNDGNEHHIAARGGVVFDADALRAALARAPDYAPQAGEEVQTYRAFYGLNFPHLTHSHTLLCLPTEQARLVVQYFVPDVVRGQVMLCHGYYDHVGLFGFAIEYFLKRGIAVVTYDQIGHGLSTGAPVTIDSFDRYVAATRAVFLHVSDSANMPFKLQKTWHWFGQSMGGAVVMEYLQQFPPDTQAPTGEIVLLAPLVRPYAWWFNRWVFAIAKRTISERPRTLTNNAENPEFHALQQIDPLQAHILPVAWVQAMVDWSKRFVSYPVSELAPKLLQGDQDRTVDWRYNIALYERRYPHSMHFIIPGGRHHLANESAVIRMQMRDFLDEHCRWGL